MSICLFVQAACQERPREAPEKGVEGQLYRLDTHTLPQEAWGEKSLASSPYWVLVGERCAGLEDEEKPESTRLGDGTNGALGLGVPWASEQGRAWERRYCLTSQEMHQCPGQLHSFLFLYFPEKCCTGKYNLC